MWLTQMFYFYQVSFDKRATIQYWEPCFFRLTFSGTKLYGNKEMDLQDAKKTNKQKQKQIS